MMGRDSSNAESGLGLLRGPEQSLIGGDGHPHDIADCQS